MRFTPFIGSPAPRILLRSILKKGIQRQIQYYILKYSIYIIRRIKDKFVCKYIVSLQNVNNLRIPCRRLCYVAAIGRYIHIISSISLSHILQTASLGILQSPLGERLIVPTFGPSGMQERLNCMEKNLL